LKSIPEPSREYTCKQSVSRSSSDYLSKATFSNEFLSRRRLSIRNGTGEYKCLRSVGDGSKGCRLHQAARGRVAGEVPWMQAVTDETNLPIAMAQARGTGATAIKVYADVSAPLLSAITVEAHRQHMLVWAHAAVFPARPIEVADAGVDAMSHACMLGYEVSDPISPAAMHPLYQWRRKSWSCRMRSSTRCYRI
jgi:hypothetical protein